eukprot:c28080_g2_i4 orf=238-528(+)
MSNRRPQVVLSLGCLKVAQGLPTASVFNGSRSVTVSPAAASVDGTTHNRGPFHGLTICVTGLSKGEEFISFEIEWKAFWFTCNGLELFFMMFELKA